jgi:hypothetical protein
MQKVNYEGLKEELKLDEEADFKFQERRHPQWTENYQLFRDKVIVNRLTQRQSINVPFIKGIVKTVMANIDEFPDIEFEELDNDKDKEIVTNELWKDFVVQQKFEIRDIVDKKQDLLYGITHQKFNIVGGKIVTEIKEPFDILKDRYSDPADINTSNHLSEHGIYRTLAQLESNPMFDRTAINRLKLAYAKKSGLIKSEEVTRQIQAKNERLEIMGVPDLQMPELGQTWFELKTHFKKVYDLADMEEHWHLIVMADSEIIMAKPLMDILGIDELPFVSWSDDPERLDQYPDGTADIARTTNKLLNSNISSLAENGILRNFGMNFYDSSIEGFVPQSYQPIPFGWYGIPVPEGKKIDDVFKKVDIPNSADKIQEMEFVKRLVEIAVAANTTVQGGTEKNKITLGEIELALSAAKERISSIAKFYNLAMKDKGMLWSKLLNANADILKAVKLYKKSHKGNYFPKIATGKEYKSEAGYNCRVVSSSEREKKSIETIQKLNAVKAQFPNNPAMAKIYGKKILEFVDLNPEEIKEVMEAETQNMQMLQQGMPGMPPDALGASPRPQIPPVDPLAITQPNAIPA